MAYFDAPYRPADLTLNSDSINNDLVGFWPLTDGSGSSAVDISTGGNDGTLSGTTSWVSEAVGTALQLDGSSGRSDASVSISGYPVTLAAWFKTPSASVADECIMSIADSSVGTNQLRMIIENTTSKLEASGFDGTVVRAAASTTSVDDDNWHLGVAVFASSTSRKIYVDGVLEGTETTSQTMTAFDRVSVGVTADSTPTAYFGGEVQNARVFDAALTDAQVEQLYTRPWTGTNYDTEALWLSPPSSPTLSSAPEATALMTDCVGWWPLTKGSGTTATDLVGSNDGTLSGTTSWVSEAVGTSLQLDGSSGRSDASVSISGYPVTLAAWFKTPSSAASNEVIISAADSTVGDNQLRLYVKTTGVLEANALASGAQSGTATGTSTVDDDEWHFGVAVYESSTSRKLYVDGVLESTNTTTVSISACDRVTIGVTADSTPAAYFGGELQNARLFDAVLTADQIRLLYERPWIGAEYNESDPLYPPVPSSLTPLDSGNSILTDLELWLPLTDGSGTTAVDISGGGNDGTLTGTSTNVPDWYFGRLGNSIAGDGTNARRVEISNAALSTVSSMSVSCWIYNDSVKNYEQYFAYGQLNYLFNLQRVSTQDILRLQTNSLTGNTDLRTPSGTLKLGVWQHVVGTYDGSTKRIYFDGIEVASASATGSVTQPTNNTALLSASGSGHDVDGKVANVRVWSRALSASEVADLYYSPWIGSAYPSTSTGAPRFLINGLRPLLVNGGLVR